MKKNKTVRDHIRDLPGIGGTEFKISIDKKWSDFIKEEEKEETFLNRNKMKPIIKYIIILLIFLIILLLIANLN